jgi:hypothetical protein
LSFDSWLTYDGNNSTEFERTVAMTRVGSLWMLREEEGLSGDLTGRSLGRHATDAVEQRGVVAVVN